MQRLLMKGVSTALLPQLHPRAKIRGLAAVANRASPREGLR